MSSPSAPSVDAAPSDPAAVEMADLVTAIFRMLDDNIDAVVNAGSLASSRVEFGSAGVQAGSHDPPAPVPLVGAPAGGLAHGVAPHG